MRPSSAKAKGRRLQQRIRDDILRVFRLEAGDVESRSMGAGGTDLLLSPLARARFPYAIECKNVENVNVWKSFVQAVANESPQCRALLVIARNKQEPLVVLRWTDFIRDEAAAGGIEALL